MAIPNFQMLTKPVLAHSADGELHSRRETTEALAVGLGLTEEERQTLLPSGQQTVFGNRVGWAFTYLKKAGLIEQVRRGAFRITERGRQVLRDDPIRIDLAYLERFPEYLAFRDLRRPAGPQTIEPPSPETELSTPEEQLDSAYQRMRTALQAEVLDLVRSTSPSFFEELVVELLLRMGYGGSRSEAGQVVGRSGDGGIDGVIKEDRLGLDVIYVQAKKWENTVGRPEIQKFAGALQGHRARKGVFITTADFSREAVDFAARIDSKIVLIGGDVLASLMVDHGVGVSTVRAYEVKKIDSDYFAEE